MTTVVLGEHPAFEDWLAHRRELGQDGRDEVWEGVYHVAPHEHPRNGDLAMQLSERLNPRARAAGLFPGGLFNIGVFGDFRIPDLGFHRSRDYSLYLPSAAIVVEVLSKGDKTFAKFAFYAQHDVAELWVVDPVGHTVRIWQLAAGDYAETGRSDLLGLHADDVAAGLDWP